MKTRLSLILLGTMMIALLSFKISSNYDVNHGTAEVQKIQGLYIFFASKPVAPTEYLGTVKVKMTSDSESTTRLNKMIKNCKKEYPQAEALIFNQIDFSMADAVTFKK